MQVSRLLIYQAPACSTDPLTILTAVQKYADIFNRMERLYSYDVTRTAIDEEAPLHVIVVMAQLVGAVHAAPALEMPPLHSSLRLLVKVRFHAVFMLFWAVFVLFWAVLGCFCAVFVLFLGCFGLKVTNLIGARVAGARETSRETTRR